VRPLRDDLVELVDLVPVDLRPLAACALGLFDRFELLDCLAVMRDAADWAEPAVWHAHARAWADELQAQLLASIADAPAA
jgi:hypothetical protein